MRSSNFGPRYLQLLAVIGCFSLIGVAGTVSAETVSELLEKAIYTEETVGDLDAAIEAYKKVLVGGQDSIQAAAQAQYRIGLCYEKQGDSKRASEAFGLVVQRYPTATRWVAQAKSHLPGTPELLPVPWGNGDELQFEMKLATGMGVGQQIYRVAKVQKDGRDLWECMAWQNVTINGQAGKSKVLVDAETYAPIESHWRHSLLGEAAATYQSDKVDIKMVGKDELATLDFDGPVYDNEQVAEMFRRMPLKVGYKAEIKIISTLSGIEIPLGVHVTKTENLEVPAGEFECFRLKLSIGQTFWISNDENRYIVRFQAGGVTADLNAIRPVGPEQNTTLENARFTATLPPDWFSYDPSGSGEEEKSRTTLIDPEAAMNSRIEAGPVELVKEKHETPKEWLEASLRQYKKRLENFSMSDGGIQEISVGGHQAAIAEFDFIDGDKVMKGKRMAIFGDTSAVNVRFTAEADRLEHWERAIKSIQSTLQVK